VFVAGLCLLALPALAVDALAIEHPILFVQELVTPSGQATVSPSFGSRIVRLDPDGSLTVLTEGFAAAADPCVSFDAQRVIFAAKLDSADAWDIWEMEVDGSRKNRVTSDLGDCREPVYLPLAAVDSPDFRDKVRWISFTSTAPDVLDDQGCCPLTSLYAMNLEAVPGRGTVVWRTTSNLGGDVSPTVLSDGRVLFSARQRGALALMTISWAGENLNPFYGSHDGATSQIQACELPDRTVVFLETQGNCTDRSGRLARVSLRRPLRSHEVLSAEEDSYRTPSALDDGRILVSFAGDESTYGIFVFDPVRGERVTKIHDDPRWHDVDAVALTQRPEPPGRIPTVEFASVLDVGSLKTVGQLQCMNVYESDRPWTTSPETDRAETVRFIEGIAAPLPEMPEAAGAATPPAPAIDGATSTHAACDSTWPPRGVETRVLGEAPIEEDGSFYVNVPGDVPFYMELLDGEGRSLQTMRAWLWVRAGDQRGCIGCHEDKELAPVNRATDALIRARPVTLTGPGEDRRTAALEKEE
jgi:Tol biopolymer transport system component